MRAGLGLGLGLARAASSALILCTLITASPSPSRADTLPGGWSEVSVGVLPIAWYGRQGSDLFAPRPEARAISAMVGRWQRILEDALARRDLVRLVRVEQLQAALIRHPEYRRSAELGGDRFSLGLSLYEEVRAGESLGHFERAQVLFDSVFVGVAEPHRAADVALYRGLASMEGGDRGGAHVAFREMLMLEPSRRFRASYYPADVEAALVGAQEDMATQRDPAALRFSTERLHMIATRAGVDVLVLATLEGPTDATSLRVRAYDRRRGQFTISQTFDVVPGPIQAAQRERVDRRVSAWHTCLITSRQDKGPKEPKRRRWFLDISYIHSIWLRHDQTRQALHGPGAQLSVAYEPTPAVQVYFRTLQVATLQDPNRDLLDVFVTSRLSAGVGLLVGADRFRFFARFGPELALSLSNIDMTTNVDCKHFGLDDPRCKTSFTAKAPSVWFGLDVTLGVRWALSRNLYFTASIGITSYVAGADLIRALNFPLNLTAGFGAPF